MKTAYLIILWGWLGSALAADVCAPLLNHRFLRLQDEVPQTLCQYQGKVLLVVNTAS